MRVSSRNGALRCRIERDAQALPTVRRDGALRRVAVPLLAGGGELGLVGV